MKFILTTEGGMNDGTAFPFVMLSLGVMGLEQNGFNPGNWIFKDLIWAITAGIAC